MNVAPDLNNHLRSIDLFRSMIIKKTQSKVPDSHRIVIGNTDLKYWVIPSISGYPVADDFQN